jgi:hypothetical protein
LAFVFLVARRRANDIKAGGRGEDIGEEPRDTRVVVVVANARFLPALCGEGGEGADPDWATAALRRGR